MASSEKVPKIQPDQPLHFFAQGADGYQSDIPYGNNSKTGRYVQSGDARIYYEVYGSGDAIVLLHGGTVGSLGEMGRFADNLKNNHQVIMVNTRGHGKSDIGKVSPSYKQKSKDLHEVLSALKVSKVDIIGFSDGGYTGFQFAVDYPDQINRLVAIGAGEWPKGFVQGGAADRNGAFKELYDLDPRYWSEQAQIRPQYDQIDEWYRRVCRAYDETEIGPSLFKEVRAPVLLLSGEKDMNAPLDTMVSAYKALPNAQLGIIPGAPHTVFFSHFDLVWGCIKPFLNIP